MNAQTYTNTIKIRDRKTRTNRRCPYTRLSHNTPAAHSTYQLMYFVFPRGPANLKTRRNIIPSRTMCVSPTATICRITTVIYAHNKSKPEAMSLKTPAHYKTIYTNRFEGAHCLSFENNITPNKRANSGHS